MTRQLGNYNYGIHLTQGHGKRYVHGVISQGNMIKWCDQTTEHLVIIQVNALITHATCNLLTFHNHLLKLHYPSKRGVFMKYKGELNRSYKIVTPKVVTIKQMRITKLTKRNIEVE